MSASGYEFSGDQNRLIGNLAGKMGFVGLLAVILGLLNLVMALLVTIGIPAHAIGIILGVDRILDMCRTVLNVTGDLTVAACVARSEGHILKP